MKKLILLLIAVIAMSSIKAQKISADNVPQPVLDAFKTKFSIAEKTAWEIDYDNYEANFVVGKTDFSGIFDKEGKWLATITYLKPSELPKNIRESLSKKYGELSAYKIEDAIKMEKEKETTYEMEIIRGENTYEVEFDNEGEMMKEDKKSETKKE